MILCRRHRRGRFHPWVRLLPGEGNGSPLQRSCLENPRDRGARQLQSVGRRVEHMAWRRASTAARSQGSQRTAAEPRTAPPSWHVLKQTTFRKQQQTARANLGHDSLRISMPPWLRAVFMYFTSGLNPHASRSLRTTVLKH